MGLVMDYVCGSVYGLVCMGLIMHCVGLVMDYVCGSGYGLYGLCVLVLGMDCV